jgi:tetratricopeptide (TPR) repeat protein
MTMQDAGDHELEVDVPWPDDVYLPPRRRKLGAWIMALVVAPSLGVLGWAAEKRFQVIERVVQHTRGAAPPDGRAESFVEEGERALAEGDLDRAQGDFDRASVLADRDPRALVGEARVADAKADIPWLKLHLLPPGASEASRVASSELEERVAVARRAADDALTAAPQDSGAIRTKLDALRLAGDTQGAHEYVVAVFAQAADPETAYVLAALDLGQPTSPWPTVVERLRVAAGPASAGRARAALVYALARSGDVTGAKAELAKLDAQQRLYPLLPELHAWLEQYVIKAQRGTDRTAATTATPAEPASSSPAAPPAPAADPVGSRASAGSPPLSAVGSGRSSVPTTVQAANQAISRGEFERAERIYEGILATDPNDSQTLTGLGDVLRLRTDPWGAIEAYERAIKINPSYLPAQLGLADTQWSQGDQAGAGRSYRRIVDHFPDGMYPAYVTQRAAP